MESKKSIMANELWCRLAVAHNFVLFMYANCLITYCSTALILFIVVFFFFFLSPGNVWMTLARISFSFEIPEINNPFNYF